MKSGVFDKSGVPNYTGAKKKTGKVGRPSCAKEIEPLYLKGLTDSEISFDLRISQNTVIRWRLLNNKTANKRRKSK